jgi:hypothetical protein
MHSASHKPSAQIGTKIAHASSQALAQERAQRCSVDVTDLGCDGVEAQAAAMEERLRMLDTQVLKVGKRRFAKHVLATPLQRNRSILHTLRNRVVTR